MKRKEAFTPFSFTSTQIASYLRNAERDLAIAKKTDIPEVIFTFAYNALLKAGITLIAYKKSWKVRSIPGHHIAVIETLGELLNNESIATFGNTMRSKRNADLYGGGIPFTEKEAAEYTAFVESVIDKVRMEIKAG